MGFITFSFLCLLGFSLNIFVFYNMYAPLLWIPYVLFKIFKKQLKPVSILFCIVPPVIWFSVLLAVGFFFGKYIIPIANNTGFMYGGILALIVGILNVFGKSSRDEFISGLQKFAI